MAIGTDGPDGPIADAPDDPAFQTEEQFLLWRLAKLQGAYQRDAEPYIKALMKIRALQPPPPIIINIDDHPHLKEAILQRLSQIAPR